MLTPSHTLKQPFVPKYPVLCSFSASCGVTIHRPRNRNHPNELNIDVLIQLISHPRSGQFGVRVYLWKSEQALGKQRRNREKVRCCSCDMVRAG